MANKGMNVWEAALWLGAGAVVGAGVALLVAPRSGKETRRGIARFAKKAGRGAEEIVAEFSGTMAEMVDAVGKEAGGILDRGKGMALDAKKELLKTIDEAQGTLEKQRTRLAKLVG